MSQPPIDGGVVCISEAESRRRAVETASTPMRRRDNRSGRSGLDAGLGQRPLPPGLLGHARANPKPAFVCGLDQISVALKAQWTYSDYAKSWLNGAHMLLRRGVTTVADIEAVPELLPEVWSATPLRVLSFLEMTGVKSRRPARNILREAVERVDSLRSDACSAGLSPHAPYSTTPELLSLTAEAVRHRKLRATTHVAESSAEFDMFMHRRGPLYDWLKSQRSMSDCGQVSPVRHLEALRVVIEESSGRARELSCRWRRRIVGAP